MSKIDRFKEFIVECGRVLRITRKPTKDEYWVIAKVAGIGLLIIGAMGFILSLTEQLTSLMIVSIIVILIVLLLFFIKR